MRQAREPVRRGMSDSSSGWSRDRRSLLEAENRVERILQSLATLLLDNGFGIAELNKIARRACLLAAKQLERRLGRRLSNARIAAITGLTRAEVTRLLREGPRKKSADFLPGRAHRVAAAWCSDKKYRRRGAHTQTLPFYGKKKSFESLVREYGGDIPPRAMLAELQRLEIVKVLPNDKVELLRACKPVGDGTIAMLAAVNDWSEFFAFAAADPTQRLTSVENVVTLKFESLSEVQAAIRELQARHDAFVQTLRELTGRKVSVGGHALRIKVAVATSAPKAISKPKSGQMRRRK